MKTSSRILAMLPSLALLLVAASAAFATSEADTPFPSGMPLPKGVTVPVDVIPDGFELADGDMLVPEGLQKGTVWEPNLWPSGVLPYAFVENDASTIFSVSSTTISFGSSPPRIFSSDGSDDFVASGLLPGLMILVSGSSANDNDASTLYTIVSSTSNEVLLETSDTILNEGAGLNVTISPTISVSPFNQGRIVAAMAQWENAASIDFRPRASEGNYLLIRASVFNRATVGKPGAGTVNTVEIWNWTSIWIMCHELAHSLGEKHEQSRPDRETFVTINWPAVSQTACGGPCDGNFNITTTGRAYPEDPGGAIYDFDSVMHYGQYAFTIFPDSVATIVCQPGYQFYQDKIGQRNHLSFWDLTTMSYIYADPTWVFLHQGSTTVNPDGSFWNPSKNFAAAVNSVSVGAKLVVLYPDTYSVSTSGANLITTRMEIEAPTGGVIFQ